MVRGYRVCVSYKYISPEDAARRHEAILRLAAGYFSQDQQGLLGTEELASWTSLAAMSGEKPSQTAAK